MDIKKRLQELKGLREADLITEAEFNQQREKLLSDFGGDASATPYSPAKATLVELIPGMEIGPDNHRFRLAREIGGGAMGRVWQAHDLSAEALEGGTHYKALKVVAPELMRAKRALENLKREALRASKLNHSNIINVNGWQQGRDNWLFVEMEYLEGYDLDHLLFEEGEHGLPVERVLDLLKQMAKALDYAHQEHRIIHRDLKPGNVYISEGDRIKILDFGLAYQLRQSRSSVANAATGDSSGTPIYMSPEAFVAGKPDPRQDVYALACLTYELLTGQPPYSEEAARTRPANLYPPQPEGITDQAWEVLKQGFGYDREMRPDGAGVFYQGFSDGLREQVELREEDEPNPVQKDQDSEAQEKTEAEAEFAESILISPDSSMAAMGRDEASSLTTPTHEASFMGDFSSSDIDALQDETGDVDPLSEADIYIAYGHYQRAEELIKQAIEKAPERIVLKHKLAQIYFSAKKPEELIDLAQQLHDAGLEENEPDTWSKIKAMAEAVATERVEQKDYNQILWEEAKQSDDPEQYKHYLSNVPDGRYRLDAQRSLSRVKLEREPEQSKQKPVPEVSVGNEALEAVASSSTNIWIWVLLSVGLTAAIWYWLEWLQVKTDTTIQAHKSMSQHSVTNWVTLNKIQQERALAEQGNTKAQSNLGWRYAEGRGVARDDKEAVKWYRLAAKQGDAKAQYNLGVMHEAGRGVTKDEKEAVRWYRLAAQQGHAKAQYNLGWRYENGRGVARDVKEAVRWYRKAAKQNNWNAIKALNSLGI